MINIDTNILVRTFLQDDEKQSKAAQKLMKQAAQKGELFISSYALLEFIWVLKVKKFTREEIYRALITLIDSPGVSIGQRETVLAAAEKFYKGKADFGDYMIFSEGERYGARHLKTFDEALLEDLQGVSLP